MKTQFVRNASEAADFVVQSGMLPFLKNDLQGFSLEDHVPDGWFASDDHDLNPWYWRYSFVLDNQIAYGKFFNRKLGFVSKGLFGTLSTSNAKDAARSNFSKRESSPLKPTVFMRRFLEEPLKVVLN